MKINRKLLVIFIMTLSMFIGFVIGQNIIIKKYKDDIFVKDNNYYVDGVGNVKSIISDNILSNNITLYKYKYISKNTTLDRKFLIYGKNNNNKGVYISFELEFYDEDNNKVDYKRKNIIVNTNTEFVTDINFLDNSTYNTFVLKCNVVDVPSNYELLIDNIKQNDYSSVRTNNGKVYILFKNNLDKEINYLAFSCVFYKDNNIIDYSVSDSLSLMPNKGISLDCNNNIFDYDEYKIYLSEIYSNK